MPDIKTVADINISDTIVPQDTTVTGPTEIDLTTARAFKADVDAAGQRARGAKLTLDLTRTKFMDSAGLEAVVLALKRREACGYTLHIRVQAGSQPQKVLRLSRLDALIPLTVL